MPRLIPNRLAAACLLALSLTLSLAAGAAAKGFRAELRVVGGGKVLAEKTLATATTAVEASPRATCFGPGSGGSGDSVVIPGNTALGLLARGSKLTPSLRPLLVSDHFDFGLAICGVGSGLARGSSSWYLKVNHVAPSRGGEKVKIERGDEVLWALVKTEAPDFAYPDELALSAPAKARRGEPFTVRVFAYDGKGRRKPVAGARVTGAAGPTDARGAAEVTLSKSARLIARFGSDIPSNREPVCVGGKCTK